MDLYAMIHSHTMHLDTGTPSAQCLDWALTSLRFPTRADEAKLLRRTQQQVVLYVLMRGKDRRRTEERDETFTVTLRLSYRSYILRLRYTMA